MTMYNGNDLKTRLNDVGNGHAGVFGICYSILTWSGVGKGLSLNPSSWVKSAGKLIENGHATTFLINNSNNTLTLTGISDDGWLFENGKLGSINWARHTTSATTYVYYRGVDAAFLNKYKEVKNKLKNTKTSYAVLYPNRSGADTQYQNCVSHSHYLMHELGLESVLYSKGFWVPSISNWAQWLTTSQNTGGWKYQTIPETNTHIPE